MCPKDIFVQLEKLTIPEVMDEESCIACGQCVAICLQNAICHSEFPSITIRAIQFEQMPTTEQVMKLLKTRRSIRAFRDKPLPNNKSGDFYGISATYQKDKGTVTEDLLELFSLLEDGKINPIIYKNYSILDVAKANQIFESGEVIGKIVLSAP